MNIAVAFGAIPTCVTRMIISDSHTLYSADSQNTSASGLCME